MGGSNTEIPESPTQLAQANVAKEQYADYQKRWAPVVEFYKNRLDSSQGGERNLLQGQAATDVQGRFGAAKSQLESGLRHAGVMIGSGKDIGATNTFSNDEASALGSSKSAADSTVDQQYLSGLQQIIATGRGQRAAADSSLSSLSSMSGNVAASNAEAAAQDAAGLGQLGGTAAGLATSYGLQPYLKGNSQNPSSGNQNPAAVPGAGIQPYTGTDSGNADPGFGYSGV